ncbi:glycosyltransferase [Microbacterium sp. A82]|uniref:glycosyltransferase n=1 Tax=Microbacterium sp. A82 TaxID=3450452 RepID=UPI003F33F4F8
MNTAPRVSIVIPLFNDEEHVAAALDSCLSQTVTDFEVICVDDASTDSTASIVEQYAARDPRITLIRLDTNGSAFQARRIGVMAASAPFVLFLDGDDELVPRTAQTALTKAETTRADVVGFGVTILASDGVPSRLEAALQPQHSELTAPGITPALFPVGEVANGHIWRYCFSTALLRGAYEGVPGNRAFYRANDLPITFLALALAEKYVSIPDRLYVYYFRRGTSGHAIGDIEHFKFLLSGVEPIMSIDPQVNALAAALTDPAVLLKPYESARLHIIGNVLRYCIRDTSGDLQRECIALLLDKVGATDTVRAAAAFCTEALGALTKHTPEPSQPEHVRNVLLTTSHLETGGLQEVLLEHVGLLAAHGHRVTVAVMQDTARAVELPDGVDLVLVTGESRVEKLDHWMAICREYEVDVVIDHHILYNDNWPWFALAALAAGVPTIGWIHNFALRPLFDGNQRTSFLTHHMSVLLRIVTLSPTDVAFWKLQGLERVVYLPNPPTRLARQAAAEGKERRLNGNRIELAWWGRLDRLTKQVPHLVDAAAILKSRGIDFRLTLIGPDSRTLSAKDVRQAAAAQNVADQIDLLGEQTAAELLATLRDVDMMVSASAIEGYQLTIIEAQALGIPVVMYDLPWLATVEGNKGLISVEPGDPSALADAIAGIAASPDEYSKLSRESRTYAQGVMTTDLGALLDQLLHNALRGEYSPPPTTEDATILMPRLVEVAERNIGSGPGGRAQLEAEITALRRERDRAKRKLRDISEGPSFRIGRMITAIPRRARRLLGKGTISHHTTSPATGSANSLTLVASPPPPLRRSTQDAPPTRVTNPDVTVVVPVYNSELWLDDCLSSVLAQTGTDIELICVNDGSTDGSRAILQRFEDNDPRVTVIDQPNSGQSVGRNVGLDAASGRYVIYLDSDDYWPHDSLAALVQDADRDSLDVLLFDCLAFRDGEIDAKTWKRYSTYYQRAHAYRGVTRGVDLMAAMRRGRDYRPHVGMYLARTDHVRATGVRFIPGIVHQDNPYTFRLLLHAQRVAHTRVDVYARRMRPGSTITTLKAERSARGYFLSYVEMSRELTRYKLENDTAGELDEIVDGVYDGARKQFVLLPDAAAEEIRRLDVSDDAQAIFQELRTGE